ncbi:MAG: hypothetical protein FJ027_06250 [Candidatus Rokubacteria bacterium]|nr:hypothetical protein [Candidatus Rokubacteria bacterium]
MRRPLRLAAVATLGALVAGCAVLTIDVDVYKGALSNHESVQTEQLAAMAMGVKPLIAELRAQLERRDCYAFLNELEDKRNTLTRRKIDDDYPDLDVHCPAYFRVRRTAAYLPDLDTARSRDTARVNAILSLYENQDRAAGSELVRGLEDRLQQLRTRIKDGMPVVEAAARKAAGTGPGADARRTTYFEELSREALTHAFARPCVERDLDKCPPPVREDVRAVTAAWQMAREAWREAMRLLSSQTNRERLGDRQLDVVAWAAASLTSPAGLRRAVVDVTGPAAHAQTTGASHASARAAADAARRTADQAKKDHETAVVAKAEAAKAVAEAETEHETAADTAKTLNELAKKAEHAAGVAQDAALRAGLAAAEAQQKIPPRTEAPDPQAVDATARGDAAERASALAREETVAVRAANSAAREAADRRRAADSALLLEQRAGRRLADARQLAEAAAARVPTTDTERRRTATAAADLEEVAAAAARTADAARTSADAAKRRELPSIVLADQGPFNEVRKRLGDLAGGPVLEPWPKDGKHAPPEVLRRHDDERRRAEAAIRGALSELLQDNGSPTQAELVKRRPGGGDLGIGRALATQLLIAEAHAESLNDPNGWFVALYPSPEALIAARDTSLANSDTIDYILSQTARAFDTGLTGGRLEKGLETLIAEYLDASRQSARRGAARNDDTARRRSALLDALVNAGEKISVIANLDILLRDRTHDTRDPFITTETEKYVRLLQAVGNSILSQVDALRQADAQRQRLVGTRDVEVRGIRNAEARATATLREIRADIGRLLPDKDATRTTLTGLIDAGNAEVLKLVSALSAAIPGARDTATTAAEEAGRWDAADAAVGDKVIEAAIHASKDMTVTETAALIKKTLEAEAVKHRQPTTEDVARAERFEEGAKVLARDVFTKNRPADAKPAKEHYAALRREIAETRKAVRARSDNAARVLAGHERWYAAADQLGSGTIPIALPGRLELDPRPGTPPDLNNTAKDVLDVMLATLKYEHVAAVARDRNSELAKNKLAAVELLYAYRSGMIHIRPSATFLRNSYPATVLQNDPSAGVWRNMLTDHATRQLPFYAAIKGGEEDARITRTIDKQFWQSVNQVRVSGAGNTNYAIAKDDVGNWYVKDYGSNPKDIIESAKNLAMFSAGPSLGANLLSRGGTAASRTARTVPSAVTPPAIAGEVPIPAAPQTPAPRARTTLGRQFDRYAERFDTETRETRTAVRTELDDLHKKVRDAVFAGGVSEPDLRALDSRGVFVPITTLYARDRRLTALARDTDDNNRAKSVTVMNGEIAAALRLIRSYRLEALTRTQRLVTPAPAPPPVAPTPPPPSAPGAPATTTTITTTTVPVPPATPATPTTPANAAANTTTTTTTTATAPPPSTPAPSAPAAATSPAPATADTLPTLTADGAKNARATIDRVISDVIARHLAELRRSAAVYESALLFIGETAGL